MRLFSAFYRPLIMILFIIPMCISLTGCDNIKPTMEEACSGFDRDHTKDVYYSETTKKGVTSLRIVMVGLAKSDGRSGGDPVYDVLQDRINIMQRARATCPPDTKSTGQYRSCKQKDKMTGYAYKAIDYNVKCPAKNSGSSPRR